MIFVERGIHTVELYLNQMPYAEVQTIVEDLYHLLTIPMLGLPTALTR